MSGKYLGIAVCILLLLTANLIKASNGKIESSLDEPAQITYIHGDWIVDDTLVLINETIVLSGNLTIDYGGDLTFINVTLRMNCTASQQWRINVLDGGVFSVLDYDDDNRTISDRSILTSVNPSYNFLFLVREQAIFEMRNSELSECGGGYLAWPWIPAVPSPAWYGLCILTDDAFIDSCHISNNRYGIVLYGSDANVSNNTIEWCETGILATTWSDATIENNIISWSNTYGIWVDGWSNSDPKPSNPILRNNTILYTGRGVKTGDGLQIEVSSSPIIKDTKVIGSMEDGLYMWSNVNIFADNLTIDPQGGNYAIVGGGSWNKLYLVNSSIGQGAIKDVSISQSYFVFTNTTFNPNGVSIDDTTSNLTVNWFLHTHTIDTYDNLITGTVIRIRDIANGTYDRNFTTDENGFVNWTVLKEYYQTKTSLIHYDPYTIEVSRPGYHSNSTVVTMNRSKTVTLMLEPTGAPIADAGEDIEGIAPYLCQFNGSGTILYDADEVNYTWTFEYDDQMRTFYGISPSFSFDIPGTYIVTLTTSDADGATTDTVTVTVLLMRNVAYASGWRLVSIPVGTDESRPLSSIFADEWDNIEAVQWYNADDGEWKLYSKGAPTWLNTLIAIDETMGVWVRFATDGDGQLTMVGNALTTSTITLHKGWNLVGYPSMRTDLSISRALAGIPWDIVQKGDATRPYGLRTMPGTYLMKPGEGYWVHVTEDSVWIVKP